MTLFGKIESNKKIMKNVVLQGRSWEVFVRATKESNDIRAVEKAKADFDRERGRLSPNQEAYKNNESIYE